MDRRRKTAQLEVHVSQPTSPPPTAGSSRYDRYVEMLRASITQAPGALASDVRAAIVERNTRKIPPALAPYVIKVALHAYKITDEDILQLKREGLSEDEIFEATASAAVGAALLRLEKGMAALRGA